MGFQLQWFFRRRAMVRPNFLYFLWRYGTNGRRARLASQTPPAFPDTPDIAAVIAREGIVQGDSSAYLTPEGVHHLMEVKSQLLERAASEEIRDIMQVRQSVDESGNPKKKNFMVNLLSGGQEHSINSAVTKLVLDPKLLEIVAGYLGLWPKVYGVHAPMNFPTDEPAKSSQLWHRDPEDLRQIKVFIYLVDVDEDNGPFSYVPKTHAFGELASVVPKFKDKIRIEDDDMNAVLPPHLHHVCTGPADTMILADTIGYHRGGNARGKNRILLRITYTSNWSDSSRFKPVGEPDWQLSAMQRMALE